MKEVLISEEAHEQILSELREIKSHLQVQEKQTPLSEPWLDNVDVCQLLKVSKRTLQSYRDEGKISFSQIGAKIFYRASDIETFLTQHYNKAFKNF